MPDEKDKPTFTRRELIQGGLWGACALGLAGLTAAMARSTGCGRTVWQIDPAKCIHCGNCATYCVLHVPGLKTSAVKCVHSYSMCGYCKICMGYFPEGRGDWAARAENQLCPVNAIERAYVDEPYYQYNIKEDLCIGCGKCVEGCEKSGNGSLFLQIRHDRCVNCNQCAIARACPTGAISRIPADKPYLLKSKDAKA